MIKRLPLREYLLVFASIGVLVAVLLYMMSMQRNAFNLVSDLSGEWKVAFGKTFGEVKDAEFQKVNLPSQKDVDSQGKDFHWMLYKKAFVTPHLCTRYEGEKCAILISEIGDAAEIYLNGKLLQISGGLPPNFSYAKHYPVVALLDPNSLRRERPNDLLIRVYASKQPRSGLRNAPIGIATYKDARYYYISSVTFDVVIPIGIAVLLAVFSLLFYRLTRKAKESRPIIVAFGQMCMAYTIYLVFVSNMPREFLAPWLAVHLHCLFRFLSDWTLFDVTWKAYSLKKNKVKSAFNIIYASVIAIVSASIIFQIFSPESLRETLGSQIPYIISGKLFLLAFAPLVLGIVASFISKAHDRPKIWTAFYLGLLYFQVNDTLVFLEVIKGIYFVRFYPLLVAIFLGLEVFERYRRENEKKKIDEAKMQAAWDTANQVVHDIQSPLSAYRTALDMIRDEIPEERRVLFRDIYSRLSGITASLSKQMKAVKNNEESPLETRSIQSIASLLDSLVAEKRLEFQGKLGVNILFDMNVQSYGVFSSVMPNDFKRVLSNLINNAVEATDKGCVSVSLSKNDDFAFISIKDSGKGMSKEELMKLGIKGVSWKENGSGLGFSFAKKCVESWNGAIDVESEVGRGSVVQVKIPIANAPEWFIEKVRIGKDTTVVILDDDPSIHSSWETKLKTFGQSISIKHFSEPVELKHWIDSHGPKKVMYFIDYEFLNSEYNGLSFILENKLEAKSILVTSRADEEAIKLTCSKNCIKLLPKAMVSSLPIDTSLKVKPDAVLMEDDEMVISTWLHSAKRYRREVRAFSTRQDLLSQLSIFDFETKFFLDSRLKGEERGEDVARLLYNKGFRHIYMATSNLDLDKDIGNYIKGIVSKSPPWIANEENLSGY